jgi:hypothetical protein
MPATNGNCTQNAIELEARPYFAQRTQLTLNGKTVTATVRFAHLIQNNLKAELLKVTDVLRSRLNDRAIVVEVQLDEQKAVTQSAARPAPSSSPPAKNWIKCGSPNP